MKWNIEQLSAITEMNKNILVSAAAGSGKTAVLTERICRLVKDDCGVDELLVVTFTNAAASEMRDRICKGLNEAMNEKECDQARLADQIDRIGSANISTFHAFCYEVVRTYFYLTDLTADFGLCDKAQEEIYSEEAIEEVLNEFFQRENADFLRFLRRFSKPGNERSIASMVTMLHRHIQSIPDPERWLKNAVKKLEESNDEVEKKTVRDAKVLRDLTLRYGEILLDKKLKNNQIGFDDAQHYSLNILENPEIAEEYRERFKYIFIDEYQDTNAVQEALISKIARKNNVFMVGDVKQSIYGFRLADPGIFIEKYKAFCTSADESLKIDLSSNFRSRPEILETINKIMEVLMTEENCGLAYDENAKLKPSPVDSNKEVEIKPEPVLDIILKETVKENMKDRLLYELKKESNKDNLKLKVAYNKVDDMADVELEAMVICDRIKEIIGKTYYDRRDNKVKTVGYRDIAVLMRAVRASSQIFQDVFQAEGIPCYVTGNDGYFETTEIAVFMNILKVVVNRLQDIPLLSVIHSPCFGFSSEEIAQIRIFRPEGLFSEAFLAYSLNENTTTVDDEDNKSEGLVYKCRSFLSTIERWREAAGYISLRDLLWKIADESGFFEYIRTLPMARHREANLKTLFSVAESFGNRTSMGVDGFVNYVEKLSFDSTDFEGGTVCSENSDCVKIMTIHKSKGLEFPIVFVAGLGRRFNHKKSSGDISLEKDLGMGLKMRSEDGSIEYKTSRQLKIDEKKKNEEIAEEMRLLYVAMTRAEEKLFLLGTASRDKEGKYLESIDEDVMKNKNFLEWVYPVMDKEGFANRISGILPNVARQEEKEEDFSKIAEDSEVVSDNIPEHLKFVKDEMPLIYAHSDKVDIPVKFTATELTRIAAEEKTAENHMASPDEKVDVAKTETGIERRERGKLTAAERGTITHTVLQSLDFKSFVQGKGVREQIDEMVNSGKITADEATVVNLSSIEFFLGGSLGKRLLAAERVYREKEFLLLNKYDKETGSIIQGVIDCFFIEDGKAVIIDYKTDYIPSENRSETLKAKTDYYKTQLKIYKSAVTEALGIEVKEMYLCFLNAGAEIKIS